MQTIKEHGILQAIKYIALFLATIGMIINKCFQNEIDDCSSHKMFGHCLDTFRKQYFKKGMKQRGGCVFVKTGYPISGTVRTIALWTDVIMTTIALTKLEVWPHSLA